MYFLFVHEVVKSSLKLIYYKFITLQSKRFIKFVFYKEPYYLSPQK